MASLYVVAVPEKNCDQFEQAMNKLELTPHTLQGITLFTSQQYMKKQHFTTHVRRLVEELARKLSSTLHQPNHASPLPQAA